ncbi:MAG: tetratricopeptide repeat protein [Chloroflexia bacterium]
MEPFSLEELGLEGPELPAEEVAGVAAEAPQPFRLEELGLTEEEISGLGLGPEELAPVSAEEPVVEVASAAPERPPLEELRAQVAAQPADASLRLELARICAAEGAFEEGMEQYRWLIKNGGTELQQTIILDIRAWAEKEGDERRLQRLHRLLGDAYMKAGSYAQAVQEYAWVLSRPVR